MLNDEYRPSCPKCGENGFIAVNNSHIANADNSVVMIICSNLKCQCVVGCLPYETIYKTP